MTKIRNEKININCKYVITKYLFYKMAHLIRWHIILIRYIPLCSNASKVKFLTLEANFSTIKIFTVITSSNKNSGFISAFYYKIWEIFMDITAIYSATFWKQKPVENGSQHVIFWVEITFFFPYFVKSEEITHPKYLRMGHNARTWWVSLACPTEMTYTNTKQELNRKLLISTPMSALQ